MRLFIPLIIFLILLQVRVVHAITVVVSKGNLVHESVNTNTVDNLIEDILSLVPEDMARILTSHYGTLIDSSRVNPRRNYFTHKVININRFKEKYYDIALLCKTRKTDNLFAQKLGETMVDILEIAMQSSKYDPTNDNLKKNMFDFINIAQDKVYSINYNGCEEQSFDKIIENINNLQKYNKESVYPQLVVLTAQLWTSIWTSTGNKPDRLMQSFVRQPIFIRKMPPSALKLEAKIMDDQEAEIVRRYGRTSTAVDKIVDKRVNEYVDSYVKQLEVENRERHFRKEHNIKEDYVIISSDNIFEAIKAQRSLFKKTNSSKLKCGQDNLLTDQDSLKLKLKTML